MRVLSQVPQYTWYFFKSGWDPAWWRSEGKALQRLRSSMQDSDMLRTRSATCMNSAMSWAARKPRFKYFRRTESRYFLNFWAVKFRSNWLLCYIKKLPSHFQVAPCNTKFAPLFTNYLKSLMGVVKKRGYFTVRLTVSVDRHPPPHPHLTVSFSWSIFGCVLDSR